MLEENSYWRKCSSCKKPIAFSAKYYVCSVSTCNGLRTGYAFCTVACFETHLPGARHRDAAAVEKRSGTTPYQADQPVAPMQAAPAANPQRVFATAKPQGSTAAVTPKGIPREILVVASKLKDYIRARADMNTSAEVLDVLSDKLRRLCDDAIDSAREQGRKTVLDRDFKE